MRKKSGPFHVRALGTEPSHCCWGTPNSEMNDSFNTDKGLIAFFQCFVQEMLMMLMRRGQGKREREARGALLRKSHQRKKCLVEGGEERFIDAERRRERVAKLYVGISRDSTYILFLVELVDRLTSLSLPSDH